MKELALSLLVAAASLGASQASATVLTFDDLGSDDFVPVHYGGLDWSDSDWFAFSGAQDPYTPHSGSYRIATGFGDADVATSVRFAAPSVFQGAWFAGVPGATVTFLLYNAGVLVATSATLDPGATPQFLSSGYGGLVDRLVVSSPDQGFYVLDDLTFTRAVPEPAIGALMLAGLCAAGAVTRRRGDRTRTSG